jgi:hypothetical protein
MQVTQIGGELFGSRRPSWDDPCVSYSVHFRRFLGSSALRTTRIHSHEVAADVRKPWTSLEPPLERRSLTCSPQWRQLVQHSSVATNEHHYSWFDFAVLGGSQATVHR